MTWAIGEYAISGAGLDLSTPDRFKQLLNEPEYNLVYLIEMYPFDETIEKTVLGQPPIGGRAIADIDFTYKGAVRTLYFSDLGFATEPSDSPANTNYKPATNNPFQFDVNVFNGEFTGQTPSFGAIRILNGDGDFDDLSSYYWQGRNIKVFVGGDDFARDEFVKVFDGLCSGIEFNEDEITINIKNNDTVLQREFVQSFYEGTGGLEGSADLEGSVKPLLYGEALRISPILVDSANLIYQIHDVSMQSVDAVYDRGVELTSGGDVADITAASVSAGQYKTQLSGGYIKLGSTPDGQITADAKGDNTGGYVSQSGSIISRLLRTKLGLFNYNSTNIDQGSLNTFDANIQGDIGIYINDVTNLSEQLDLILTPLQAYWLFDREGMFTVGFSDVPSDSVFTFDETNIIDGELDVLQVYSPTWRFNIGYARRWTSQNEIAAAASDDYRTFNQDEYRKKIDENRTTRRSASTAVERFYDTLLVNQSDAESLTTRLINVYRELRYLYRIRVSDLLFQVFIGDTVTLRLNRFGLLQGKDFVITAISEDAETGITELELWG